MKEKESKMLYLEILREKLGISPKKCIYKLVSGEIIIYSINDKKRCLI